MAEDIVKLGQMFSENRELLLHNKAGGFEGWFTSEGFKRDFVYQCIAISEKFSTVENLRQLNAPFSVLYQLSLPGIPESALDEVIERSAGGEKITAEVAKGIVEGHKDWRLDLIHDAWYPVNQQLKIVVNERFTTGNALHRKYPWGTTKTTYDKKQGMDIYQGSLYADYKLVEPGELSGPRLEYTGEQSEEAQQAAEWILRKYLEKHPNWSRYYDKLIIDDDPIDLKKRLSDTKDPDHITFFSGLTTSGGPGTGPRAERISAFPRRKTVEPVRSGWEADKMYPVDDRRKWVFDHPLSEDEAQAVIATWYPMCVPLSGSAMMGRGKLEVEGWTIQAARGEPEDEQPQGEQPKLSEAAEAAFRAMVGEDEPEEAAAPSTKYQPGMRARCGRCEGWYNIQDAVYDNWTFSDSMAGAIWTCPKGHRISDPLMDIVVNPLVEVTDPPNFTPAAPQEFAAILIDPPWEYTTYSEDNGQGRSAEAHYPTMKAADIAALPVGDLAADNCALFMWATWPTIQQAFMVGTAWGFEYRTCAFTWAKVKKGIQPTTMARLNDDAYWHMGMGFWTRANTEVCLLFVKGAPKRIYKDVRQLIVAPVRKHSQKPDEQYERIARLVGGPYLELFAREKRTGWFSWGNEIESDITFGGIEAVRS
jgi:N6-adenosine-specific RNA methylase IME4